MTYNSPVETIAAGEAEYFDVEQAAALCCVSHARFARWLEQGEIPVIQSGDKKLIHNHDLVLHFIRHHIPIPERLLSGRSKKALFVLTEDQPSRAVIVAVLDMLSQMRDQDVSIVDLVRHNENMELKVITLNPDFIFVLQKEKADQRLEDCLRSILTRNVPVLRIPTDRTVDMNVLLYR